MKHCYVGILLVIFGGIVFHAPLSVSLSSLLPSYELVIKSWKEILMGLATVIAFILLYRHKQLKILKEPLAIAVEVYAVLHLVAIMLFPRELLSIGAGLLIDLRYLLFFALVYIAVRLYPGVRRPFILVAVAGALVVTVFAVLQVFVLPADILKYLGYSDSTIAPYLTIDQNQDFIRISSTMRGPNPLGAYVVILLSCLGAWVIYSGHILKKYYSGLSVLAFGGLVSLWSSYSRSAVIAGLVAVAIVVATNFKRIRLKVFLIGLGVLSTIILAVFISGQTNIVSNVVLHENPLEGNSVNSNDGHVKSLQEGFDMLISQPLGSGVGSTGSASMFGNDALVIENQYLFIAHEVGWGGLVVFLAIFTMVMQLLWVARKDWLALGMFASGVGMAIIGVLLPVWVDDTVAIIWWGLAALVIGGMSSGKSVNKKAA